MTSSLFCPLHLCRRFIYSCLPNYFLENSHTHSLAHTHFRPHTHAEQAASYHKYADPKVSFCRLVACCIEITYIFLLQLARGETCNIPLSHSHTHSLSFFSFFPLFFAYFLFLCFFGYDIMKHGGRPGNLAALRERERKRETSSDII